MTIDWNAFTPGPALLGGLLIGLAAGLFILGNGRIAGISGIVGGAVQALWQRARWREQRVRWAFIAGLLAAPCLWRWVAPLPAGSVDVGPLGLVAAGLLVGFGTRMGNGCTSGHGVCGISRRSPRSLAATAVFMAAGFAVVFVMRHGA